MCRLLGIFSNEAVEYRMILREAPKSLCALSREHPHGWGLAVFAHSVGWHVEKAAECADTDSRFHEVALGSRGVSMVAHVRKRTIGELSHRNTHPFVRGSWVFCHNGTIVDVDWLARQCSPARLAERQGETDSEILLAFLLSRLDAAACELNVPDARFDDVLRKACDEMTARGEAFGSVNFLMSNGETCYAHRFGRSLYLLERSAGDPLVSRRVSEETGAVVETPWSSGRRAILIASEVMTDEPWQLIEERSLVRIDRSPVPGFKMIGPRAGIA
ncbi:MAG: class II glutamine amidotransferase [Deltaproteobacteria bacterium]|nr:class II glutamine amidotransferase [Deltaproteobacteria bacterium]